MLKLARMFLTVDDLDACQQQCVQLLKMDAENDDATVVSTCVVIGRIIRRTMSLHTFMRKHREREHTSRYCLCS